MKYIVCSTDINKRMFLVIQIMNPMYDQVNGSNIWLSDKMIDKIGRAFPRGKARKWYVRVTKRARDLQLKNKLIDKSNRLAVIQNLNKDF